MFQRRRAKARPAASAIVTPCGLSIPFADVVAVMTSDVRDRPAAGIYPGQTHPPAIYGGGVAIIHRRPDGSTGRAVLEGTVPELLARIAGQA